MSLTSANLSRDGDGGQSNSSAIWKDFKDLVDDDAMFPAMLQLFTTISVLCLIILATMIGNSFVIAAIVLERTLRSHVANYLVASLAVADLLVAVLVMPLAAVNEVSSRWFLGRVVCDAWTSLDLICCTSSILHLLAISLDRYLAVTRLDYIHRRSTRRVALMITASWTLSILISAPPLFIDHDPDNDPDITGQCVISQNLVYTVFSTVGAFYLPFMLMMIIYWNVFRAARARIRRRRRLRARGAETIAALTRASVDDYSIVSAFPRYPVTPAAVGEPPVRPEPDVTERQPEVVGLGESKQDSGLLTRASSASTKQSESLARHRRCSVCPLSTGARRTSTRQQRLTRSMSEGRIVDAGSSDTDNCQPSRRDVTMTRNRDDDAITDRDGFPEVDRKSRYPTPLSPSDVVQPVRSACGNGTAPTVVITACCSRLIDSDHRDRGGDIGLLPRKAAARLLTPLSTPPPHRSSWLDLTRTLFSSSAVSRQQVDGPSATPSRGTDPRIVGRHAREHLEQQRERKAARTLAVITGTFVLCWLPFFVVATLRPFCSEFCHYPSALLSVIGWLGYANSLLNPVIYTVFNADFRSAFRKILFGKYRRRRAAAAAVSQQSRLVMR